MTAQKNASSIHSLQKTIAPEPAPRLARAITLIDKQA